jgi:hypothetical protein
MNTINPWKTQFSTASGEPIPGNFRLNNQSQAAFASNGEINASNITDALQQITRLMQASSQGQIKKKLTDEQKLERRLLIASAYNDQSGKQWQSLGATIAESIKQQAEREGFMRRLLGTTPLTQGQDPKVDVHDNTAVAVFATSMAEIEYQQLRQKSFTPPEFPLESYVMVGNDDIQKSSGDLLERVYNDCQVAVMVGEDRRWRALAEATSNMENPVINIGSMLSPSILSHVRSGVNDWGLPATSVILASNLWDHIIGNPDFHTFFTDINRYDLILNGQLGTLLGMEVITDAFRNPNQKVLDRGDFYVVASPEYHGQYSDRGGVVATPVDGAQTGKAAKGWFLYELLSMVIASPRSVSIGKVA